MAPTIPLGEALGLGDEAMRPVDELLDLIRLARTFGFYLARLDIRQESTVHTAAVADALADTTDPLGWVEDAAE